MRDYSMIDRLEATLKRYNEIGEELSSPEIISDIKKMTLLSKERTSLEKTVEVYKEYKKVLSDIEEAKELLNDKDMASFAKEELAEAESKKSKLESELEILLIPHDPNDEKNVIVEEQLVEMKVISLRVIYLICIVNMLRIMDGR